MNTLLEALSRVDRAHIEIHKILLAILSVVVSVLMVIEIVTRFVFRSPLFGLEEITLICMMWLYMIGAVVASHKRAHLDAEMMELVTSRKRVLALIRALATFVTLIIAGFILAWSYSLFAWGLEKQQGTPVFRIPWVVSQSSLFFASIMFVVYLLRDLFRDLRSIVRTPQRSPSSSQDVKRRQ
jgi:TRAP-type C4-dicarboxylate transport system permease small subunit